jgi:hypothetical protein
MAEGNEVLREIGGKVGRYLSELYRRVEELERRGAPAPPSVWVPPEPPEELVPEGPEGPGGA